MTNDEYVKERDALIPFAERYTDKHIGKRPADGQSRDEYNRVWTITFLDRMNLLSREAGLVKC